MLSIRSRFLLVSAVSVALALALAAVVLIDLFGKSLERRLDEELSLRVNQIASQLTFKPDGHLIAPSRLGDPRFLAPYGGVYWQLDDENGDRLRSRSLWDTVLPLPDHDQETGTIHRYRLAGPEGTVLITQERALIVATPTGPRAIRVAVAVDDREIARARAGFARDMFPSMIGLALFLLAVSAAQLTFGLKPLALVSDGLNRIRERRSRRLDGTFPSELKGVVAAVNHLLDVQDAAMEKARARAADLAHGLKTPLTILANDAETLRGRGEAKLADEIEALVRAMQAHVSHELTRSRLVASPEQRRSDADLPAIANAVVRTLKRTPRGEALTFALAVPDGITLRIDPHDLREIIGNVVENAVKWARSRVEISAKTHADGAVVLAIEDDGPGVDPARIHALTERGTRLDTRVPGSGLGLSIVREIADIYGLGLAIENREAGGLAVTVSFPAS